MVPKEYGYILMIVGGTVLLNIWHMMKIGSVRRQFGIKYPIMYSEQHPLFNCYQRAHLNMLENLPFFLATLLTSGFLFPLASAGFGALWLVGRVIYSMGYYSGKPEKRIPGVILASLGGQIPLLFLTFYSGASLLQWI